MVSVFISYRREDSAGHAGRLYDDLVERFGRQRVFMDIDHLYPGVDWIDAIEDAIGKTGIMLVVIGRHWSTVLDAGGQRRLDDPDDFLRREIALALDRTIRVIPVLVQGASMPKAADLPEDLRLLTRRHAFELSDGRWAYDAGRLADAMKPVLDRDRQEIRPPLTSLRWRIFLVVTTVISGLWTGFYVAFIQEKSADQIQVGSEVHVAYALALLTEFLVLFVAWLRHQLRSLRFLLGLGLLLIIASLSALIYAYVFFHHPSPL